MLILKLLYVSKLIFANNVLAIFLRYHKMFIKELLESLLGEDNNLQNK